MFPVAPYFFSPMVVGAAAMVGTAGQTQTQLLGMSDGSMFSQQLPGLTNLEQGGLQDDST
jgi:hypothetical protein